MAQMLTIFVGNYKQILQVSDDCRPSRFPTIIGQHTETNADMVKKGENIGLMMLGEEYKELILFTNNDHFLNGIRLACAKSRIDFASIIIYFLQDGQTTFTKINILSDGQISVCPSGFCDSYTRTM